MATTFYLRGDRRRDLSSPNTMLCARPYRGFGGYYSPLTATCTASGNNIQFANGSGVVSWFTMPFLSAVTIAGSITFNFWGFESVATANASFSVKLEKTDSLGNVLSTIVPTSPCITEFGTTTAARTLTVTPTSTAMLPGQMVKITVFAAAVGTMAAGTATLNYNSQITAIQGDSFVTFTETITEAPPKRYWWLKQFFLAPTLSASPDPQTFPLPGTGSIAVTVGNVVILGAISGNPPGTSSTVTSATISGLFVRDFYEGGFADCELWHCVITGITGAGNSFVVEDNTGGTFPSGVGAEVENLDITNLVVASGGTTSAGNATVASASLTPVASGQLMIAVCGLGSTVATPYQPTTANAQGMESGVSGTANPTAGSSTLMSWIDTPSTAALTLSWTQGSANPFDCAAGIYRVFKPKPGLYVTQQSLDRAALI